jgi:plasmid stability protein
METILDLPDSLVREIKLRAEHEGRELKEVVVDMLAAGLAPVNEASPQEGQVVAKYLPLIKARPAAPTDAKSLSQQEWCEWLKEVEQQHELERYERVFGHQYVDRADG